MAHRSIVRFLLVLALVIAIGGCKGPTAAPIEYDCRTLVGRTFKSVVSDAEFARLGLMTGGYFFIRDGVLLNGPNVPGGFPNVVASVSANRSVSVVVRNHFIWIRDDVVSGAFEKFEEALAAAGYDRSKNPHMKEGQS